MQTKTQRKIIENNQGAVGQLQPNICNWAPSYIYLKGRGTTKEIMAKKLPHVRKL